MISFIDVVVVLWVGVLSSVALLYIAWFLYFITVHRVGSATYLLKLVALGLLTIPIAILLTPVLIAIGLVGTMKKIWRTIGATRLPDPGSATTDTFLSNESAEPGVVTVHLVHGTFEPNAEWTIEGSAMRNALQEVDANVRIERFIWSGKNTRSARDVAAEALADKLRSSPNDQHYIVTHSHGGNIVREMSYAYPEIAGKVRGVCMLSPPIIFWKRINRTGGNFVLLNSFGFVLAVQIPIAAVLMPIGAYWPYAALLSSVVAFVVESQFSNRFRQEFSKDISRQHVDFRNVQILHAVGDEADSALRFSSFLHEACFSLLSQLKSASKLAGKRLHLPYYFSYIVFTLIGAYTAFNADIPKHWLYVTFAGLASTLAAQVWQVRQKHDDDPTILVAAALPVAALSFWLGAAKAIAFGDMRLMFSPEIFVTSSETPVGDHTVLKFEPESDDLMVHSTHSHTQVVVSVAAWLASSLHVTPMKSTK